MLAESAVRLGSRIAGDQVTGATSYWRNRYWDRDEAEASPRLGPEYLEERQRITRLISEFGDSEMRAIDLACGTGAFSSALLETGIASVQAVDVSAEALSRARKRIGPNSRITFIQEDFWSIASTFTADLVVCVDALHHLGMPADVLRRIGSFTRPGAYVIGNYWTKDHFHEFSRMRHGRLKHEIWSVKFLLAALVARAGIAHPDQLRTIWLDHREIEAALRGTFSSIERIEQSRYFLTFVARR